MSENTASRVQPYQSKPLGQDLWNLFLLLLLTIGASALLGFQSWRAGGVTIIWPANGFLIAYLLSSPRNRWPAYLLMDAVLDFVLNIFVDGPSVATYLAGCNLLEVWLAAILLYRIIAPAPDLTRRNQLLAFLGYGVFLSPLTAAALASLAFTNGHLFSHRQFLTFRSWTIADALGVATITPLYLSYRHRAGYTARSWFETSSLFLLLTAATMLVFLQDRYPLLFILMPILLLLGMRTGLAGSALGLAIVAILGGLLTSWGFGPTNLLANAPLHQRDLALQVFIAVTMLMLYIFEVVVAESRRLQRNLKTSEAQFRTLAESSRDIIIMAGLDGKRHYVSPAVLEVLGYQPEEMIGKSFRDIVHPKDIAAFEQLMDDCRHNRPTHIIPYRCRTKSGEYHWLEANPRPYCDPVTGRPVGVVSVVRDIAERKKAEEELARAFHMAENLASIDGLTGIANRRRFDEALNKEWRRAARDGSAISLVLIDVDHFKPYNDLYGHLTGDDCLRQIVDSIRDVVTRASDLVARYGGEEFALILPNTSRNAAVELCEEILASVRKCGILHDGNPHSVVTVSAGCVTCLADVDGGYTSALQAADAALYRAKALGRNRVEVGTVAEALVRDDVTR